MSQKVPESIFEFKALDGKPVFSYDDFHRFCLEHEGGEIIMHCRPKASTPEKMKMYAFYHVNILNCATLGYTYRGYNGIDNVKSDYLLRAEFAKDFIEKPDGTYESIMLDKRGMTKTRLFKFIQDCIFFIEQDLQVEVPSAEEYKIKKETGRNFKEVK